MKNLQLALGINGAFSICTGIILIAFSHSISQLFEAESTTYFWLIGTALVLFSFGVFYMSLQKPIHLIHVFTIILLDVGWVIASISVISFDLFDISYPGKFAISVVALIVLGFALHQSYALSKVDTSRENSSRKTFRFTRKVRSDRNRAWEVISDLENYHNIAPNIDETHIVSGEGEGMVRTCSSGDHSWSETCTEWKPGEQYTFLINTSAPDYPYPLKYLRGTWGLNTISDSIVEIEMVFEFEYKHFIQSIIVHPFMGSWFRKVCENLLDNWKQKIEEQPNDMHLEM
jgi:ribosome-associated toxin RatA of RatAB toxin-antitoxin module